MNENEVPSLEEIIEAWESNCCEVSCEECKLHDENSHFSCRDRYAHAVLAGKMKLSDSFREGGPKPKPKLPMWCKEGAWVTTSLEGVVERDHLYQISRIEEEDGLLIISLLEQNGGELFGFYAEDLNPVRFRSYNYEESKKLLGKVMEFKKDHGIYSTIIYEVSNRSGHVCINDWSQGFLLNEYEATIDGAPFGVPEIDEVLLRVGAE